MVAHVVDRKHAVRSNTGSQEVEQFEWVGDSSIQEAGCLTLVRDTDVERVAEAFGAVLERARGLDFEEFCEEAFAHDDIYSMIGVRRVGAWTLVVEDNWFEGARPEVLRRVSAGTEVVSAFWNVNALTRFSHAVDGEVRTSFEALMPGYREGTRPDALEELRSGLPWSDADLGRQGVNTISLMLALTARITGQAIRREWLRDRFTTYPPTRWQRGPMTCRRWPTPSANGSARCTRPRSPRACARSTLGLSGAPRPLWPATRSNARNARNIPC
jgi:hypothetical protein